MARVRRMAVAVASAAIAVLLSRHAARADDEWQPPALPVPYVVGAQTTVVWQYHPRFHSPYEGPHSLGRSADNAVSHSYDLYVGARPLSWLDLYVNPEMVRGGGIGDGLGLAGYTNGEVIRNPEAGQDPFLARAFVRATLPLGEERETVADDLLQVASERPTRRLELTAGVLGTTDVFDQNRYAASTRTQFLNWSFITNPAYDFAADTRGYTRGAALSLVEESWTARIGTFQMPEVANGLDLDSDLAHAHGDQGELDLQPSLLPTAPLVIRMLGYVNHARMGDYREAIADARANGTVPDVTSTRRRGRVKWGVALNLEQPLTTDGDTGLFARFGWNDGHTETFAYTEADWTASLGAEIGGAPWRRPADDIGIAAAANGLSGPHADYLGRGGLGFELGDGRLRYRPETVVELYYLVRPVSRSPWIALTADYQLVVDPGSNADRGPVSILGLRLHLEGTAGRA
jgi:hypothetical protein